MTSEISRDEVRSAIEDKLCAYFGITDEQATEDLLTFKICNSRLEERSNFRCSDNTINKLQAMARNSTLSNFYYFPTDCPQREKNGWTGDASVSACQMLLSLDCAENFRMWLESIRGAQLENGKLPGTVPTIGATYNWGCGPAWDSFCINLPYFSYQFDHREDIIRENSDLMWKYLHYACTLRMEDLSYI